MEQMYNKLSKEVVNQLPSFVREDYATFVAFLQAYYEYVEQDQKVQEVIRNAKSYLDVDQTIDEFVEYFLNQYAYTLPKSIFDDTSTDSKRLFVKYASDLYKSKGSESAYKLLFRLIYGEEITFFYPNEVLFKPSSGNWTHDVSIKTEFVSGEDAANINGKLATGATSKATVVVDYVSSYQAGNKEIYELFIDKSSLSGEFVGDEMIVIGNNLANVTAINSLSSITVIDGGRGYSTSDDITITGTSTTASINKVSLSGGIKEVGIRFFDTTVDIPNVTVSIGGPSKVVTGTYTVTSNVATLAFQEKPYLNKGDTANIVFHTGAANVISGNTEILELAGLYGVKTQANVANTSGTVSLYYLDAANLQPVFSPICYYSGTYGQDFQGQTDHDIKLQDSRFYQQFSYVIRSNIGIDEWRDVVKSVLHPAGFAIFGELFLQNEVGEESVYVGVDNAYDAIVIFIKGIIGAITENGIAGMPGDTHQPTMTLAISPVIDIESCPDTIGPTRGTVDRFKFQYDDSTPIEVFDKYTIEFFTDHPNKNRSWNIPPPSEIVYE